MTNSQKVTSLFLYLIGWIDIAQMSIVNEPELISNIKVRYNS
jgi:hypothetical protein